MNQKELDLFESDTTEQGQQSILIKHIDMHAVWMIITKTRVEKNPNHSDHDNSRNNVRMNSMMVVVII